MKLLYEPNAAQARPRVLEVGFTAGLAERVAGEVGGRLATAGAFEQLPFPPASFDYVVAAPELSDAALRELRRVLHEVGQLVAVAPQSQWFMLRHFTVVERRHDVFICTP